MRLRVATWRSPSGSTRAPSKSSTSATVSRWLRSRATSSVPSGFLHEHYSEGCTVEAAKSAHFGEHIDIFHWLLATYPDVLPIDRVRDEIARVACLDPQYTLSSVWDFEEENDAGGGDTDVEAARQDVGKVQRRS